LSRVASPSLTPVHNASVHPTAASPHFSRPTSLRHSSFFLPVRASSVLSFPLRLPLIYSAVGAVGGRTCPPARSTSTTSAPPPASASATANRPPTFGSATAETTAAEAAAAATLAATLASVAAAAVPVVSPARRERARRLATRQATAGSAARVAEARESCLPLWWRRKRLRARSTGIYVGKRQTRVAKHVPSGTSLTGYVCVSPALKHSNRKIPFRKSPDS
ncbi:unnamed protein product, partial [Phaeothamnion confervicola]